MKFTTTGAALLPLAAGVSAIDFSSNDDASIKSCSQTYANGLMSQFTYSSTGYFPKPHYWWESGAIWGGLIEFSQIFDDTTYVSTLQQALTLNYGPNNTFLTDDKRDQQGNDDQAFWCLATMSAAEYGFPEPADAPASYLEVTETCFKNIMSRWDTGSCGGGLKWQIYPENSYGYDYKNAISNGAAFALAARLARFTGNTEYSDWAKTIYDWTAKVGLIGSNFEVFDGTDDKTNCASVSDKTEWTYNNAMFLHGSAFMYDVTKADTWKDRTNGFLKRASRFFDNPNSAESVMYEVCEPSTKGCNVDQQSFKAYLSRWMAKTAILAPFTKDTITNYLTKSAAAAAKACSGGDDGKTCGSKWYTGSFDSIAGLGQQLSALEVTQALAMIKKGTLPGTSSGSSAPVSSSSAAPSSTSVQVAPSSSKAATTAIPSPSSTSASSAPASSAPASSVHASSVAASSAPASSAPASSAPATSAPVPSAPAPSGTSPAVSSSPA
ncbi:mannan endo-1,6-alpha-mannosidase, partial [Massarina eburnea CBS 473.64]